MNWTIENSVDTAAGRRGVYTIRRHPGKIWHVYCDHRYITAAGTPDMAKEKANIYDMADGTANEVFNIDSD